MDIIEKIKKVLGKYPVIESEQIRRLRTLPKDQAQKALGELLYDQCVKCAAEFVNSELSRGDSPFRGMSTALFFDEIVSVTFWIMDKKMSGGKMALVGDLHDHYFNSYACLDKSREERHQALIDKYNQYEDNWNEITGHFDEFALCVVRNIFGQEESRLTRERNFWIIRYADEMVNFFSPLKKVWKEFGGYHEKPVAVE